MAGTLTRRNFLSFDFGDRSRDPDHWVRIHRMALATRFEVMLSSDEARDIAAGRLALDEADDLDAVLSTARDASVVSHFNRRAAREEVTLGATLFALLARSAELHAATGGAFDVTAAPLARCWSCLEREGRLPSEEEIAGACATVGMEHVRLNPSERTARFAREGMEVDFDPIARGFALDRMAGVLLARGTRRALLSAGHTGVLAIGGKGRGWPVDLRPRLASRRVGRLWIKNGAVSTSGAGEQVVEIDGQRYGQVVDPRSGRLSSGVLGASVIARDAATADALSAAFLVDGPDLARSYCAAHPNVLAVLVLDEPGEPAEVFGRYSGATLEMLS